MSQPTIMYIDEADLEVRQFKRKLSKDFNILTVSFDGLEFDNLLATLLEKQFDYLIVDYQLNEMSGCGFDGDRVLKEFLEVFPHFPAMLLTNQDEGAIESVKDFDVEKVRSKKEYLTEGLTPAFSARIKAKIEQYNQRILGAEERLKELAEKRTSDTSLTADEEDETIELDNFIDEIIGADARSIPKEVMSSTNDTKLDALLTQTDDLIERLKRYEDLPQ